MWPRGKSLRPAGRPGHSLLLRGQHCVANRRSREPALSVQGALGSREPRPREVRPLAQGHTARELQNRNSHPDLCSLPASLPRQAAEGQGQSMGCVGQNGPPRGLSARKQAVPFSHLKKRGERQGKWGTAPASATSPGHALPPARSAGRAAAAPGRKEGCGLSPGGRLCGAAPHRPGPGAGARPGAGWGKGAAPGARMQRPGTDGGGPVLPCEVGVAAATPRASAPGPHPASGLL